ncbi:RagB/SusD family nutrient uptake outer membrane protein [Flavitalea flava]
MKSLFSSLCLMALLIISASSCEKDFLSKKPLDSFSDPDVWSDLNLVQAFVNGQYAVFPHFEGDASLKAEFLAMGCDEGFTQYNYANAWAVNTGQWTPDNLFSDTWTLDYKYISNCNVFFSKIGTVPLSRSADSAFAKELTGEMKLIRGYCYFDLVERYGGVPIITKTYGLKDTSFQVKRNTYDECVSFIINDLDSAALLLPANRIGDASFGRGTAAAAMALKARLLLYAASPLNNESNDVARWQKAADAAKTAIDFCEANGYALNQDNTYQKIFLDKQNSEILFSYNFSRTPGGGIDLISAANLDGGWSAIAPSQNLVDSFEMANGKMITDPSSGYDPAHPYDNRDPRFAGDIVYNGLRYRGRTFQAFKGGTDDPQGANNSPTGYNWRKYMDESININSQTSNQNWIICRLAELYLNYAEAEFELGNESVAQIYVNKIRSRASVQMPGITDNGTALRDRIHHERQIELCFEGHRIFDTRRWKIAGQTDNKPLMGVQIEQDNSGFTYTYVVVQPRTFLPAYYLWPIPRYETNKNTLLTPNPGYN